MNLLNTRLLIISFFSSLIVQYFAIMVWTEFQCPGHTNGTCAFPGMFLFTDIAMVPLFNIGFFGFPTLITFVPIYILLILGDALYKAFGR